MMRRVYLIRHAKPDFPNGERMCLGTADLPLGKEGREQAQTLSETLPPVTAVFSSGLSRAVQTAQALGSQVRVLPGLREYGAGEWDGLTFREIRQRYPELYGARGKDLSIPMPGQEDRGAGLLRFQKALLEAVNQSRGDIAVVSHGGIMAAFLKSLGGTGEKPGYGQVVPLGYDGTFQLQEE